MKVLLVNKFLYPNGGSETYILKIGKQLEQIGHKVQYFGMEHPERIVGNRAESYTSSMDFHTGKVKKLFYPFKIIYSFEARKKIRVVLQDFKPDVVHLNNFNFQLTPSIIYEIIKYRKKSERKVKIIYTAHDSQWVCPNHLMLIPSNGELCTRCINGNFTNCIRYNCIHNSRIKSVLAALEATLYKHLRTYRYIDTIICPSAFLEKILSNNSLLADNTVMLHNFIDKSIDNDGDVYAKKDYILYFGRYSREKGIETLIQVCQMLPEISFIFAGNGPLEEEIKGVPNIQLKGFLGQHELKEAIKNARFVVFPSECYENCPFSVMEAQMYGTPVLASNIGGTPELIKQNVTGELFKSGDTKELKSKIVKLWNNKELCETYSKNCSQISFDSLEEYCEKLLKIYQYE